MKKPITKQYFEKKLIALCLRSGMSAFPTNQENQNVLFKSAVLSMDISRTYTDKEINQRLEYWLDNICPLETVDFITLRRWLVDAGYLTRNKEGSCYQISPSAPEAQYFEDAIEEIDVEEVLNTAREEINRRKREHMNK